MSAALHAGDSTISICVAQWSNVDKKGDGMSPPGRRQVARNSTDPPYSGKPHCAVLAVCGIISSFYGFGVEGIGKMKKKLIAMLLAAGALAEVVA